MRYAIHYLIRSVMLFSLLGIILLGCEEAPVTSPELLSQDGQADGVATTQLFAATHAVVSFSSVGIFQPAGPAGARGVLTEGDTFGPTKGSRAKILRGADHIQVNIHTTGLPPGAYTTWWALINDTGACVPSTNPMRPDIIGDCGFDELFDIGGPSAPAVFWSTGGIVQSNGIGNFQDRTYVGEPFGDPFPRQHLWGPGLTNPAGAMVFYIIKYHGPASDDPVELYEQTHTLLGLCDDRANAFPPPNGNCFDPQWAIFVD